MTPVWVMRFATRAGVSLWLAQDAAEARSVRYAADNRPVLQKAARTWSICLGLLGGLFR